MMQVFVTLPLSLTHSISRDHGYDDKYQRQYCMPYIDVSLSFRR